MLEKAIRRSNALDTESLCILAGQKCWNVRADVHVLDYDGGLIDASCIAVTAALRHFRRADFSVIGEDVRIYSLAERMPVPLSMLHHPICVTLSFFCDGDMVLVDTTLNEQQLSEASLTITANKYGEICQMAKLGGVPIGALTLLNCVQVAVEKVKELDQKVSAALDQDFRMRNVGGMVAESRADNER